MKYARPVPFEPGKHPVSDKKELETFRELLAAIESEDAVPMNYILHYKPTPKGAEAVIRLAVNGEQGLQKFLYIVSKMSQSDRKYIRDLFSFKAELVIFEDQTADDNYWFYIDLRISDSGDFDKEDIHTLAVAWTHFKRKAQRQIRALTGS